MFQLHPQLSNDTITVGDFELCRLLLMNDRQYPWFILVPKRNDIKEIFELSPEEQVQLLKESCHLSETLASVFKADKINIAALGNMVPQLHIHHVARFRSDPTWPKPIWGQLEPQPYNKRQLQEVCSNLVEQLDNFTPDADCPVAPRVC